ncbi:MAG: hypothetical protein U0359_32640 [Byssovorax sp.]
MRTEEELLDLVHDLGNGIGLLAILAGRHEAPMSPEAILEAFEAFEAAYGPALELQAADKLQGPAPLTAETQERVARIGVLLRLPPESPEAAAAAPEIRELAEQCFQALVPPRAAAT